MKEFPQNPRRSPRRLSLPLPSLLFRASSRSPIAATAAAPTPRRDAAATRCRSTPPSRARGARSRSCAGRRVEDVRILGNTQVSTAVIRNVIRTRVGEPFDPDTVAEDYQRIFQELRKFSNVEAQVEPTATRRRRRLPASPSSGRCASIRYVGNTRGRDAPPSARSST